MQKDACDPVVLIVPGWRDSGPRHWQSLWAQGLPGARRVVQDNWVTPTREAWLSTIERYIAEIDGPVVLAAHSLGCIASVSLPREAVRNVVGALLVAPANPERRAALAGFAPVPFDPLPYPSVVVGSTNDPYCSARLTAAFAKSWGSEYVRVPGAGHINVASGHGDWPLGFALLQSLLVRGRGVVQSSLQDLAEVA
ncbi:MAG: alpha/beta hydrolase [Pseudomonadota bacterium]